MPSKYKHHHSSFNYEYYGREDLCDHLKENRESSTWPPITFASRETPILKLELTILAFHNC